MTEVSVGESTSDSSTQRFASGMSKDNIVDGQTNEYLAQLKRHVGSSGSHVEQFKSEPPYCIVEYNLETPIPSVTTSKNKPLAVSTNPATGDSELNVSIADSLASFASEQSRIRRRRRRELMAPEDPADSERQRRELEKALQSLEEMQRENKERMRRVASQSASMGAQSPNEGNTGLRERVLPFFFRTQSVGGRPLGEAVKTNTLERAMTSLAMPEPNTLTPMPVPRQRNKGSSISAVPQQQRTRASSPRLNRNDAAAPFKQGTLAAAPVAEPRLQSVSSPRTNFMTKAERSGGKRSSPAQLRQSSPSQGPGEKRSGNGECKTGSCDPFFRISGMVDSERNRARQASPDEGKSLRMSPAGAARIENGRPPILRSGGRRSVSPPIIILTVDSRRSMGEEDARRLLSAEPMKGQELYARRMLHNAEGRQAGNTPPASRAQEKAPTRPPTTKETPSTVMSAKETPKTATSAKETPKAVTSAKETQASVMSSKETPKAVTSAKEKEKSTPVPEPKRVRAPAVTRVPIGAGAAKKKESEERASVSSPRGSASNQMLQTKPHVVSEKVPTSQATKKKKPSPTGGAATGTGATKTRGGKGGGNHPCKVTVVTDTDRKSKPLLQPDGRNGMQDRDPLTLGGCSTAATTPTASVAGARRRTLGGSTRAPALRREEASSMQDKDNHRGAKSASPPHPSDPPHNASQRPNSQYTLWRRKSLSALTYTAALDRDAYRPLATDRPTVTRTRLAKRGPVPDTQSGRQFVPFCTECGKRHIDEKVKFCAFCGHKRETV